MAYQVKIVIFCASLLVVTVIARPQFWDTDHGFNPFHQQYPTPTEAITTTTTTVAPQVVPDPSSSTTAAPPVQVTTPSQEYYECLSKCPTTSEYNPICGSDSVNYHNMGRLNCAARCGTAVTMVRGGTCSG